MKKTTLLLTLTLALSNCTPTQAQFQIPYGFSEREGARIYIDFDGDGEKDIATIIVYTESKEWHRQELAFLMYLTSSRQNYIVEFGEGVAFPLELEIIENDVIQFGYVLGGTGVIAFEYRIRYNHEKRRIQVIGFDYSHRISGGMGGNGERSYNLSTGDFHITHRYNLYNPDSSWGVREVTRRGNKPIEAVFLEDISNELIGELLSITDNYGYYLINESGAGVFLLGERMPFEIFSNRGYRAQEDIIFERYEYYQVVVRISKGVQSVATLWIDPTQGWTRAPIWGIKIYSNRFKTAEGIGVGSSVADVFNVFPNAYIFYSYYDLQFWISITEFGRPFFHLCKKDLPADVYDRERMPNDAWRIRLQPSDFDENVRIKAISFDNWWFDYDWWFDSEE